MKKNPTLSSTYEIDRITAQNLTIDTESGTPLTTRQKLTLVVFIIGLALTVWGIVNLGFGIDELSGIFLAIGIIGAWWAACVPARSATTSKRAAAICCSPA